VPALNSLMGLSTVSSVGESFYGVPIGLGIRVPMLLVSPWSKGGWVCSEQFDHTSVIRFLERRFGIEETNITPWRRAVTGDLTSALDFAHPDASVPSLPDPASYLAQAQASCALARPRSPNQQSQPLQEPGLRPARALPYEIQVHGRADLSGGHFNLEFINSGRAGVCLIVYSSLRPDSPWHYTLEPGKTLSGSWNGYLSGRRYQLRVMGPNGFLREFNGMQPNASRGQQAVLEVRASYGTQPDLLTLNLFNQGHAPCVVFVEANHYSRERPRQFSLAAGASINDSWNISESAHWYDLSVRVQGDPTYLRRLAGHRETGRPSWSDPAINHGLHL
jgi:phospholipase C